LQLASRAVLAKLFPQATSLRQVIKGEVGGAESGGEKRELNNTFLHISFRQVEEALTQYQETKKEREREMAFLNKKVPILMFFLFLFIYFLSLRP